MTRLSQIVAREAAYKEYAAKALSAVRDTLKNNAAAFDGLSRTHTPFNADDRPAPPEVKLVQETVPAVLERLQTELSRLFDVTATKDSANCTAKAHLAVGGVQLVPDVPVTYLLFLAGQLAELEKIIAALPTLDPSEEWHPDASQGSYATAASTRYSTSKTPHNHQVAPATKEHAEQVHVYWSDDPTGEWKVVARSGALPVPRKQELLVKVRALQAAVISAREEANLTQVTDQKVGDALLGWLFG